MNLWPLFISMGTISLQWMLVGFVEDEGGGINLLKENSDQIGGTGTKSY